MLTTKPPFWEPEQDAQSVINKIRQLSGPPKWPSVSEFLNDFLNYCFELDQNERPTAEDLLEHPWFERCISNEAMRMHDNMVDNLL